MMRPYCVGLTGGIGAGKSTVSDIFAGLGVLVVDTDVISRELTRAGGGAMQEIANVFGPGLVAEDGSLNRVAMRALVFGNIEARRQLEGILHPRIRAEVRKQLGTARTGYALLVVPLLTEHLSDYATLVDRILLVDCDEAQQLQRILSRSGMDRAQAEAMLSAQSSRAERLAIADDVVDNRGDIEQLAEQIRVLHGHYLTLASDKNSH